MRCRTPRRLPEQAGGALCACAQRWSPFTSPHLSQIVCFPAPPSGRARRVAPSPTAGRSVPAAARPRPPLTSTVFTGAAACSGVRAPSSVASASITSPAEKPQRRLAARDPRCSSQTSPPAAPARRAKVPGPRSPGGSECRHTRTQKRGEGWGLC